MNPQGKCFVDVSSKFSASEIIEDVFKQVGDTLDKHLSGLHVLVYHEVRAPLHSFLIATRLAIKRTLK